MSKLSVATIIVCCFHLISHRVNSLSFANTRTFHLYATPASLQTDDVPTTAATSLSSSPTTVSKSTTNKRHKKRHQLRQKNNHKRDNDSPLSYQSYHPSFDCNDINQWTKQHESCKVEEEDQVLEWLMQSTSLLLGEDHPLTLNNGANENSAARIDNLNEQRNGKQHQSSSVLPPHFSTHWEFIRQSDSMMRSWAKWTARHPDGYKVTCEESNEADAANVRANSIDGMQMIEAILNQTLHVYDEWESLMSDASAPQSLSISRVNLVNIAIDAWGSSNNGKPVQAAEGWLRYLQEKSQSYQLDSEDGKVAAMNSIPNEDTYRNVIKICIRSRDKQNLEKAIELMGEMGSMTTFVWTHGADDTGDKAHVLEETELHPTTKMYNLILYGLANCEPSAKNAERAEVLLDKMIASSQCRNVGCYPDSNTFRQVVSAWTKSLSRTASEQAHRILNMMLSDFPSLSPDASTFNAIMTLDLRNGRIDDVLALFELMTDMHRSGRSSTQPDIYSINLMLKARTKQPPFVPRTEMKKMDEMLEDMKERYNVCPDVQSYNIIIDAWAKSHLPEGASHAELLMHRMEEKGMQPDAYTYTSVLDAISRLENHKSRRALAEKVFERIDSPTTPVYNAYLNALITSNDKGAVEKAEAVFGEIGNKANTRTYNTMIKAYSAVVADSTGRLTHFSDPSKARLLLDKMEQLHNEGKNTAIPDKYSYTSVISAYARSNVRRKAMKSLAVLRRMMDAYERGNSQAKPGIFAFNSVLNACAHTYVREEKVEAFTILVSTLLMIRQWSKPDDTTYGVLLKACNRLLPKDEDRKRQVCDLVLRELEHQSSPSVHRRIMAQFLDFDQ